MVHLSPHEEPVAHGVHCACSVLTPFMASGLWGCSCQLEEDQIGGGAYDSGTAENGITFLVDGGECTGSRSRELFFIRLLQTPRCGWQLPGCCMHYQPSISPATLHFQVIQSFFPSDFNVSPVCRVSQTSLRWPLCYLQYIHEARVLNGNFCSENSFYNVTSTGRECFLITCALSCGETKGPVFMRPLPFVGIFKSCLSLPAHTKTHTYAHV